jgi:SAM-dependent methyltransferase
LSIARLSPKGRVVLTDLVVEMLDIAARRARAQGVANIETKVCRADDLPFNDATFDSVSVRFGYMFFPDVAKATAEFAGVLKPGGRFCSSDMGQARGKPVDDGRHASNRDRGGGGATRPRRTEHVSVRCPRICQCYNGTAPIEVSWSTGSPGAATVSSTTPSTSPR